MIDRKKGVILDDKEDVFKLTISEPVAKTCVTENCDNNIMHMNVTKMHFIFFIYFPPIKYYSAQNILIV